MLLLLCCGYAGIWGGAAGRWGAGMMGAAALLSIPASRLDPSWGSTAYGVFAVDLCLMIGLTIVAVRSRRYWPLWAAGLHLNTVISHCATMVVPRVVPKVYQTLESVWSVPILIVMVIGISLDRRHAIASTD